LSWRNSSTKSTKKIDVVDDAPLVVSWANRPAARETAQALEEAYMNAIGNFGAWLWGRIVTFARAVNHALTPLPLDSDEFERHRDDTVFQPRDF
jgi:hypothetical protein